MAKSRGNNAAGNTYIGLIKGMVTSLVMCILSILIYAVVLKSFSMSDGSIPYFNQVIKILGILITAYYSVKNSEKLYMGLIGGVVFIIITYLLFSAINGVAGQPAVLGADIIMGGVIGTVFGIITMKLWSGGKENSSKK